MAWDLSTPGVVVLPDGRAVRGRGLRDRRDGDRRDGDPRDDARADLSVFLTRPPVGMDAHLRVHWVDFLVPSSTDEAVAVLREAHRRAARERVEIVCSGGNGRTGTALAFLATISGVPATEAVDWVRQHYRSRAVETPWQRRWVERTGGRLGECA